MDFSREAATRPSLQTGRIAESTLVTVWRGASPGRARRRSSRPVRSGGSDPARLQRRSWVTERIPRASACWTRVTR